MRCLFLFAFAALAFASFRAGAQTMYRCGSMYQDHPCESGQKGRVIGNTGAGRAAAPSAAATDAECAQRGRDSMKIVWAREGGATEDRMLSEAGSEAQRSLVRDAWRRPGSANVVSEAIQADCVTQKAKDERAALLMDEALKARKEATGVPSAAPAPVAPVGPGANTAERDETMRRELEARNAEVKRRNCSRMQSELDDLNRRARVGGNAAAMERFSESRRSVESRMRSEGC
jgi:hypothetical protein